MKAPNKIYVDDLAIVNDCSTRISTKPLSNFSEYIRKDALIEKLEKAAASYKRRSDEGELVWQNMCGINEAIEILNAM